MKNTKNERPIMRKVKEARKARNRKTMRKIRVHICRILVYVVLIGLSLGSLWKSLEYYGMNTDIIEQYGTDFSKYGFYGLFFSILFIVFAMLAFYFNQALRHMDGKSTLITFDCDDDE